MWICSLSPPLPYPTFNFSYSSSFNFSYYSCDLCQRLESNMWSIFDTPFPSNFMLIKANDTHPPDTKSIHSRRLYLCVLFPWFQIGKYSYCRVAPSAVSRSCHRETEEISTNSDPTMYYVHRCITVRALILNVVVLITEPNSPRPLSSVSPLKIIAPLIVVYLPRDYAHHQDGAAGGWSNRCQGSVWSEFQPSDAAVKSKINSYVPNPAIGGGISWSIWCRLLTMARGLLGGCAMVYGFFSLGIKSILVWYPQVPRGTK